MPECFLFTCQLCSLSLSESVDSIECAACKQIFHFDCYATYCYSDAPAETWLCIQCLGHIFPFNNIHDNDEFLDAVCKETDYSITYENDVNLDIFPKDFDDHPILNSNDIDPDINLFDDLAWNSSYITPESYSTNVTEKETLNIMHLNCRSIVNKQSEIIDLSIQIPFSILALTETWLTPEMTDMIKIPGYSFVHEPRTTEPGGGVGFLIKKWLNFSNARFWFPRSPL